jgi:cellulose biosynthesis protein BcsQ
VPDHETEALYEGLPNVRCCLAGDTSSLVELALPDLAALPAPPDPFALLSLAEPVPPPPAGGPSLSRRDLLGPPGRPSRPPGGPAVRGLLRRLRGRGRVRAGEGLGQALLAAKPVLVAVASRKGGVGKTACAAAIAAILGEVLDPFGHTAALVDANVGNPDAWGRLEIRGACPTVRETIGRLAAGRDPRSPAWSQTPALAVYPESREAGDGYTPAEVQRLATYLRLRHAAVVVDLPNRLPAFSSAEASVAAGWIEEAAVVVIPTTADPTALLGTVEYLATESVRGRRAVVPYIVPRLREIREAPEVRQMLDRIRSARAAIVEVPDDDRATLALIRRTAITEAGGDLRQAYVELSARVVEAAAGPVRT